MMKKDILAILLIFIAGLSPAFAQHEPDADFDELVCKEAGAHVHHVSPRSLSNPLTDNYDLKYYRFNWDIDPAQYFIRGSATVYFEVVEEMSEINFDLSSELGVDSVIYHGEHLAFTQPADYQLTIQLPASIPAGVIDSLTIAYTGSPPASGLGSFVQTTHSGAPILWTLSDPYGSQDWWPCKNGLGDKIDSIDVYITTPSPNRAASNGSLVSVTEEGDEMTYHWKHRYPITPYLVAIAVTNYSAYSDTVMLGNGTEMPMLNFVYPEHLPAAKAGTADLVQVLQYYDSLFVTYPFFEEKYGHAQFGWGGGMEHQTMSFVGSYGWSLLAHELAHQWFGNMVTCGSFEDIWLSEGSATYLEGLTQERFRGEINWKAWKQSKLNNITSQAGGSVLVPDTLNVNRIFNGRLSYNKGAYLLHMLRWKLGDEIFFESLRTFLVEFGYTYARTPDFQAVLEDVSGQDLDEFLADWYVGEGYPSYALLWEQEGDQVLIALDQSTSHASVDFFEMPVPVMLRGNGIDTLLRLDHAENGQLFVVPVSFEVTSVEIDPELWLISRNNIVQPADLTGTYELADGVTVVVYPNPVVDILIAELHGDAAGEKYRWQLSSMLGEVVGAGVLMNGRFSTDVSHLHTGMYVLTLTDKRGGMEVILVNKLGQ